MTESLLVAEPFQHYDAEVMLLGAVMSGAPDLDDLFATLEPGDFYSPSHGDVWAAARRVWGTGRAPEPMSVRLALADVKAKFDPSRLFDLTQACDMPANADYYAAQVANAAGLRALQVAGRKVSDLGNSHGDLDDRREQARAAVDEACQGRTVSRARTLADILPSVLHTAEHGAAAMLSTGFQDLDRIIGGLAPGRLVIFGARPGVGKSLMGTNLALHFAHHHKHAVVIASMEMPEEEVGQRLLAAHARVKLSGLQDGTTDEASWEVIARKHSEIEAMPITIDDTPEQTVTGIRRRCRDAQRVRDDLALIVVDYLQLIKPAESRGSRAEDLGQVSRGLKLLARETGACVVAMAQVNREGAKREGGRPQMTDLRESGSIEADADVVVMMHPLDDAGEVELRVDKNRHGAKGIANLKVRGHYAALDNIAWSPTGGIR